MRLLRSLLDEVVGWFKPIPSKVFPPETALLDLPGFAPEGFTHGVEILNNNRTTKNFVVCALQKHVGLDKVEASRTMLDIHRRGGALLPMASEVEAKRAAEAVVTEAKKFKYPLVCRTVSAQKRTAPDSPAEQ